MGDDSVRIRNSLVNTSPPLWLWALAPSMTLLSLWSVFPIAMSGAAVQSFLPIPVILGVVTCHVVLMMMTIAALTYATDRTAHVGSRGVRFGWDEERSTPTQIQLTGEPGGNRHVFADERPIAKYKRSHSASHDEIRELARRMGEVLGVPVQDHTDSDDWARWETDPAYRVRRNVEMDEARSRKQAPARYQAQLAEPKGLKIDHHGMSFEVPGRSEPVRITRHHLVLDGVEYLLGQIHTCRMVVNHGNFHVMLGLHGHSYRLAASARANDCGRLLWIAQEIERAAKSAAPPPEQGSEADVPETLQRARARQTA